MPPEVEQREVCRTLESLTQTVVPGGLSHSAWFKRMEPVVCLQHMEK